MPATSRVAAAVAAGYLLGRTKKLRLAITVGSLLAGGKMAGLKPGQLLQNVTDNPEIKKLEDQLRGRLMDAAKSAAMNVATSRVEALTASLRDGQSKVDEDEGDDEYEDEYEDEPEDESAEEAEGSEGSEDSDEPEDSDDEESPEAEERPRRRRPRPSGGSERRSSGASPSRRPVKKATAAKKTATKKASAPAKKTAAKKTAAKKTATKKTAAKKTPAKKSTSRSRS